MAGSSAARARGRELALLALCHLESYSADERTEALTLFWANPPGEGEAEAEVVRELWADAEARTFAEELLTIVDAHAPELDASIESASRKWRLARMDRVDRNALRLAAVELAHVPATPRPVILAEAVRLAGRYGADGSKRFVNGLADALANALRPTASPPDGKGS